MRTATTSWMSGRASSLQDWLKDRHSLLEETAAEVAGKLADKWRMARSRSTRPGAADSPRFGARYGGRGARS